MEETEESCKKRRKKMVDNSVLLSRVKSENVTLQSMIPNALEHDSTECSGAPKCPLRVPDAGVATEVMITNGTQGAESSSKDPTLIDVQGYCVKKEVAPMLQRIFDKHKDITRDCKINDRVILVPILEMICSFCQKLENLSLNIVDTELEDIISIVENFWLMGFDVKWLSERLKHLLKDSLALKEDMTKIKIKEEDVCILKQKLSTAEAELEMMKAKNYKARGKFEQQRMVLNLDGFLANVNPIEGRAAKAAQAKAEREKSVRALTEIVEVNPPTLPVQHSSSSGADGMTTADMNSTDKRMANFFRAKVEREGSTMPIYQSGSFDAYERRVAKFAQAKAGREKSARALTKIVEVNSPTLPVQQSSSSGADRTTTADMNSTHVWVATLAREKAEMESRAMPLCQPRCPDILKGSADDKYPQAMAEWLKCARALTETVEVNPPTLPVQQSSSSGADRMTTANMYSTDAWMENEFYAYSRSVGGSGLNVSKRDGKI